MTNPCAYCQPATERAIKYAACLKEISKLVGLDTYEPSWAPEDAVEAVALTLLAYIAKTNAPTTVTGGARPELPTGPWQWTSCIENGEDVTSKRIDERGKTYWHKAGGERLGFPHRTCGEDLDYDAPKPHHWWTEWDSEDAYWRGVFDSHHLRYSPYRSAAQAGDGLRVKPTMHDECTASEVV